MSSTKSSTMPVLASLSSQPSRDQVGKHHERVRSQQSNGVTPLAVSKYRDTVKPSSPGLSSSSKRTFKEMQEEISPSPSDDYSLTPVLWSELERLKFHGMNIPIPSTQHPPPPPPSSHDPRKLHKSASQSHTQRIPPVSLPTSPPNQEQPPSSRMSITPSLGDHSPPVSTPSCSYSLTPSSHSPVELSFQPIAPKEGSHTGLDSAERRPKQEEATPSVTKRLSGQHKSGAEGAHRRTRRQTAAVARNGGIYFKTSFARQGPRFGQLRPAGGGDTAVALQKHSSLRHQVLNKDDEAPSAEASKETETTERAQEDDIHPKPQPAEERGDVEDTDDGGEEADDDGSGAYTPRIRVAKATSVTALKPKAPKARKRLLTRSTFVPKYLPVPPDNITCTTCDKVLRRSGDYVRHLRSGEHLSKLGATPQGHACPGCGDNFTRRDAMIRHQRNTCTKKLAAGGKK